MTGAGSDPSGPSTTIGVLGGTRDATVDRSGVLSPRATMWELDWWIGADDRWHMPAREAAVRQQLIDGMPVVQTAMRVPGGDAVQRVLSELGYSEDEIDDLHTSGAVGTQEDA